MHHWVPLWLQQEKGCILSADATQVQYQYRMEGIDDHWIETRSSMAQYPTLEPGSYTFKVKAGSIDQVWSLEPAEIKFRIYPPWWETTWFIIACILSGLGLTVLITYIIIRNKEEKNSLRRQISESERMALRSQMNPHFVFNALNSIQHFITMEDEMSANYYLSQFSKLIRRVFENSKETFISLENEITTLKLYLELEALRFEGKFEYELIVGEEIDTYDTELPSMIIQPFVENAIWHGLMPKRGEPPKLTVAFEQAPQHLVCIVKDNGIGRKAAGAVSKKNLSEHKSSGISNTVRRLNLLSKMEGKHANVEITDLVDEQDKALGTLVTIKIPILVEI